MLLEIADNIYWSVQIFSFVQCYFKIVLFDKKLIDEK